MIGDRRLMGEGVRVSRDRTQSACYVTQIMQVFADGADGLVVGSMSRRGCVMECRYL